MNQRLIRGKEIAKKGGIVENSKGWIVPSQFGNGSYLVYKDGMKTKCTCPDCETGGMECKHQFAVKCYYNESVDDYGNMTVTKAVRVTYPQEWKSYTKAQTSEIKLFDTLLKDLVSDIELGFTMTCSGLIFQNETVRNGHTFLGINDFVLLPGNINFLWHNYVFL